MYNRRYSIMKFNQNPYGNPNGNYGGGNDFNSGGGNYSNDPYDNDDDFTYSNPYGESKRYKPFRDFAGTYPETKPLMKQPYFQELILKMSDNLQLKPESYLKSYGHDLGLSDPTVSTYDLAQKEAKKYEDMYKSIPNQRENGSVSNTYYNAYLKANEKLEWMKEKNSERANKYYSPGIQNLQFKDLDNTENDDKNTNANLSLPIDMLNALNDIANNDSYRQRFLEKKQQDNLNNLSPSDNNIRYADSGIIKTDAVYGNNTGQQDSLAFSGYLSNEQETAQGSDGVKIIWNNSGYRNIEDNNFYQGYQALIVKHMQEILKEYHKEELKKPRPSQFKHVVDCQTWAGKFKNQSSKDSKDFHNEMLVEIQGKLAERLNKEPNQIKITPFFGNNGEHVYVYLRIQDLSSFPGSETWVVTETNARGILGLPGCRWYATKPVRPPSNAPK
jgi:hypothetical protein